MTRSRVLLSLTLAKVFLLSMMAAMPSMAEADEPVVLRFASFVSPHSINNTVSIPAFIEAVEDASEGTLKIEHYPGGTFGSNPAVQLKLVEEGIVDIAEVVAAYTPGRFPELEMFELPFIFENSREAGLTAWHMYDKGYLRGFDDLELLGIIEGGPYHLHASQAMPDLASIAGDKIRVGGSIQADIVRRMGGVPIGGIAGTKTAESISRRVIDGTLMDDSNLFSFRIADAAQHHVINVPLGNISVLFPMNKDTYDSLPPQARRALDTYAGVWFTGLLNRNLDQQMAERRVTLREDENHEMVAWSDEDISRLQEAMEGVETPWQAKTDDGRSPYQSMIDTLDEVRSRVDR